MSLVFDDQDLRHLERSAGFAQSHDESTSLTRPLTARNDTSALSTNQTSHDEQTQPETDRGALDIAAHTIKALKDFPQFTGRNPDTPVRDVNGNAALSRARDGDLHLDRIVRVIDRVLQEIAEDN
jgi:hypothetical protein